MKKDFLIGLIVLLSTNTIWAQFRPIDGNSNGQEVIVNDSRNRYEGKSYLVVEQVTLEDGFSINAENSDFFIRVITPTNNIPPSGDQNFIRTEVLGVKGIKEENAITDLSTDEKTVMYQYFDGLGRKLQSVTVAGSPQSTDIVQPVVYDEFGRQAEKYLPYVSASSDGRFRANAKAEDLAFYQSLKDDSRPFTEIMFDNSPLNRPIGQYDPGEVWKSQNKKKQSNIIINRSGEIRKWTIEDGEPISFRYHAKNTLIGSESVDEDGRTKVAYKNFRDQTVIKRTLGDGGEWFDTHYIYDDFGSLRFVLSPEALTETPEAVSGNVEFVNSTVSITSSNYDGKNYVYGSNGIINLSNFSFEATSSSSFSITKGAPPATSIDGFAYAYEYDTKKRLIKKKLPGKKWEYFIYDQWDRLVMSQDGNMRNRTDRHGDIPDQWLFKKYDEFNRVIMEGILTESRSKTEYFVGNEYSIDHHEETSDNEVGYTLSNTFPNTITNWDLIQITYYDSHHFINNTDWDLEGHDYSFIDEAELDISRRRGLKGQVTGSKIRIGEGGGIWLNSINYFDDKYQNIQTLSENHLGGVDRISNEYDFTGKVTKTKRVHTSDLGNFTTLETFEYDHGGRLLRTYHSVDGDEPVLIAENSYNEIGELIERNHYSPSGQKLQSVDFDYNIRGWLTGINNTALDDGENDLFGMDLYYHNGPEVNEQSPEPRYNGNISAMSWNTDNKKDTPEPKIYGYGYDMLERLKTAKYATKSGNDWDGSSNHYDVSISGYDKNGNILGLERYTSNGGGQTKIDELAYRYEGNQLLNVKDNTSNSFGFKDLIASPTSLTEYDYDDNGNMLYDLNKGVVGMSYNHLNLPTSVDLESSRSINYQYDATGAKLWTQAVESGNEIRRTDYVGGAQYENEQLSFISMSHGRVVNNDGNWEYEYFLNDHLGNTRLTYGYSSEVNDYLATMETERSEDEEAEFTQLNPRSNPGALMNHTQPELELQNPNESLLLRGTMGAGKQLEVKAGDNITAEVFAHYQASTGDPSQIVPGIVAAVSGAFGAVGGAEGTAIQNAFNNDLPAIVNGINPDTAPKAYLIYVLFSTDYSSYTFGYGNLEDPYAASGWQKLEFPGSTVTMPYDGHLFIYVANQSDIDVYFDDLKIIHEKNDNVLQVTQSQDYYPFGLTYNAHQKEAVASINQYKFQGQEHQADFDLGWSQFKWRNSDPSIGRFFNVDPIAEDYYYNSTYAFSENRLTDGVELEGLEFKYFMNSPHVGVKFSNTNNLVYQRQLTYWGLNSKFENGYAQSISNFAIPNNSVAHVEYDPSVKGVEMYFARGEYNDSGELQSIFHMDNPNMTFDVNDPNLPVDIRATDAWTQAHGAFYVDTNGSSVDLVVENGFGGIYSGRDNVPVGAEFWTQGYLKGQGFTKFNFNPTSLKNGVPPSISPYLSYYGKYSGKDELNSIRGFGNFKFNNGHIFNRNWNIISGPQLDVSFPMNPYWEVSNQLINYQGTAEIYPTY